MSYPPAGPPPSGGPFAPPAATSTAPPPHLGFPVNVQPAAQPRPAGVWQAVLASASVVVVVIAHFWEVARLSHQSALLQDLEAGNRVTLAEARASDSGLNHSVVLQLAVTVIALVFVIVWAYHARGNAAAYTTSPFRRSKGWAIGGLDLPDRQSLVPVPGGQRHLVSERHRPPRQHTPAGMAGDRDRAALVDLSDRSDDPAADL